MTKVRMVVHDDLDDMKSVLDSIELFPSSLLEEMIADYFENPNSEDLWFTALEDDKPISIGYCAPEKLTVGTYNLYAIGVLDIKQGRGVGSAMMAYLENILKDAHHRLLIVDTSGTKEYSSTRSFYKNLGYHRESVIRDFWDVGDDKVTFWKKLN